MSYQNIHPKRLRILVIEDDAVDRQATARALHQFPCEVEVVDAADAQQARVKMRDGRYDCALLDFHLPDGSGMSLLHLLSDHMPVVFLTGMAREDMAVMALRDGAQDYLVKEQLSPSLLWRTVVYAIERNRLNHKLSSVKGELERAINDLQAANKQLAELAHTDELTNLPNLRALSERLSLLIKEAERGRRFALALVALDTKGQQESQLHEADTMFAAAGQIIVEHTRSIDLVARYGSREFGVLLVDVNRARTQHVLERLAVHISKGPWAVLEPSVHIAYTCYDRYHMGSDRKLVELVEKALAKAKQGPSGTVTYLS